MPRALAAHTSQVEAIAAAAVILIVVVHAYACTHHAQRLYQRAFHAGQALLTVTYGQHPYTPAVHPILPTRIQDTDRLQAISIDGAYV